MERQVLKTIKTYGLLSHGERCIIAVSGGADSMALLHVLHSLKDELVVELRAVHVHHGLRGEEADRDAMWVKKTCDGLGIPCDIRYVDVRAYVRETGDSVEEAARILRYRELFRAAAAWDHETGLDVTEADMMGPGAIGSGVIVENVSAGSTVQIPIGNTAQGILRNTQGVLHSSPDTCGENEQNVPAKIAVAHNMGDNAETILMQMARGSGLKGLGGIDKKNGRIIRPLLQIRRSEIEKYLTQRGVSWVTDSTNLDDEYTRNRIRHRVIPELESGVNSAAAEHIAAAGQLISQAYDYIRMNAEKLILKYAEWMTDRRDDEGAGEERAEGSRITGCRFPVDILREQPDILQGTVIMVLLSRVCGTQKDIASVHIKDTVSLIDRETGKYIMLPYGLRASREYEYIRIERSIGRAAGDMRTDRGIRTDQDMRTDRGIRIDQGMRADRGIQKKQDIQKDRYTAEPRENKQERPDAEAENIAKLPAGGELAAHFRTCVRDYSGETVPTGQYTKWFDYDKIAISVAFRHRLPGDYIMLGKTGRKSVSSYMTDRKIPGGERDAIPLVADGSHIMWIVGYRISEAYKVTEATRRVLEITWDKEM